MKVKVAKSIDFEEVPSFVKELVNEAKEQFKVCLENTIALSVLLNEDYAEDASLALVGRIRRQIIDIDLAFQDSSDILAGYVEAITEQKQEKVEAELEQTAENVEKYIEQASETVIATQKTDEE